MKQPDEKHIEKLIATKLKASDLLQNPRNRKTRIIVEMKMREMYLTGFNNALS
jgi:hypothetical protein